MTMTDEIRPTEALTEGDTVTAPKPSFTLPIEQAIEAFSAVLPHASKDDATPAIQTVRILEDGRLIATDRYTVGTFQTSAAGIEPFTVPRNVAEYVTKIAVKGLRYGGNARFSAKAYSGKPYTVRVTGTPYTPAGEYDHARGTSETLVEILFNGTVERSQRFDGVTGQFPPVVRLVDGWEASEGAMPVAFNPDQMEKVLGFAKKFHRGTAVRLQPGKTANPKKPAPFLMTVGKLTALIQPNLITR